MNGAMNLRAIGTITADEQGFTVRLDRAFRAGLAGLSGFSHAHILWWADRLASDEYRSLLVCTTPYARTDADHGVFATRSPARPNPIGMSVVAIGAIDQEAGTIAVPYIDTEADTPLIDIKPYHPASDRVMTARTPDWCAHWPQDYESSAAFDWAPEFR